MKPIAVIEHSPEAPSGYLGDAIAVAQLPSTTIRLHLGESLPDLSEVSAVVSLGGAMGAYEEDVHAFLATEKAHLREAVERDIPVLGICLGGQMLADALGGSAFRADQIEVEFASLHLNDAAMVDPVLQYLKTPVVSFRQDTWEPPPGATVMAMSDRFHHAFRLGSAVAIQSHPEASAAIVASWVEGFGRELLESAGVDPDALLEQIRAAETASELRAGLLFTAWLDEVVDRAI